MAQKYLVRCKDASQTAGTGTLTLDNSTAANWQTPAQAVTRTLLANGDTVRYTISDTADPVLYEEGIGTIGSNGLTLSRDTVRQSSSGTSKISWPSGGARDVVIAWSPGDTALLNVANTFAENITLAAGKRYYIGTAISIAPHVSSRGFTLRQESTGDHLLSLFRTDGATGSVATGIVRGEALSDLGNSYEPSRVQFHQISNVDDAEEGQIRFYTAQAGLSREVIRVDQNGEVTHQPAGNKFDAFPAGTKMLFGTAPPSGWTRTDDATTNRSILTSKSSDTPGATGGSWTISGLSFSGTSGSTAITVAQLPAHVHDVLVWSGSGTTSVRKPLQTTATGGESGFTTTGASTSQGSGDGHTHTISGNPSGDGNWRPAYQIWAPATKN